MAGKDEDKLNIFQRLKANRDNKRLSAEGNKGPGVQSRKAEGNTEEPVYRSVNESVVPEATAPAVQVTTNVTQQEGGNMATPQNKEEEKKKEPVATTTNTGTATTPAATQQQTEPKPTPATTLPVDEVVEKKKTLGDYDQKEYKTDSYDVEAARERMNNSAWLKQLNEDAAKVEGEYEDKAKKASKYAKTTAWGNMFNALGQLAGAGKNTYVKPESKYLTDAFTKSDKARELYDSIKAANKKAIDTEKAKWMANDQELFLKNKDAYNKIVNEYNKQQLEIAKSTGGETTTKHNNDDAQKEAKLKVDKKNADANMIRANAAAARAAQEKKKDAPFLKQTINGKVFSGDKADAGELAQIIKETGWQNKGGAKGIDAAALNLVLSGNLENVDPVSFNRIANAFLNDPEIIKNERVKRFLNRMNVEDAKDNKSFQVEW